MENLEIQKHIIDLGKALVVELGVEPGVDTLARWMAHYIAEQMEIAENATGDNKSEAEQHCFETILELWQHRSSLPNGRRPFESFEPIFNALARLDPENSTPYFYSDPDFRSRESDDSSEDLDEVQQWLSVARGIDHAARVWLEYVFHQAALKAADEKTIAWLENAANLSIGDDVSTIVRFVKVTTEVESEETAEQEKRAKQEKLKSRIKQLDAFIDFNQSLRIAFVAELEAMTESDSSAGESNTDLQS
jgi:hypothetical protein